jgi:predicted transcriptional regulator
MNTLTVRLPDETAARLKELARRRGMSVNKLFEEMSVQAITAFDAETRYRAMASRGDPEQALAILDRLDEH